MVDVDSDKVAVRIIIQNYSIGHFAAIDAGPGRQVDVKRVRFWIIVYFHYQEPSG